MKNIFKLLLLNKITFVLWFVLCSGQSFSQTIKIDSLKKLFLLQNILTLIKKIWKLQFVINFFLTLIITTSLY